LARQRRSRGSTVCPSRTAPTALGAAANGGVPTLVVDAGLRWLFEGQRIRLGPAQVLGQQGSLGLRALINQRSFSDAFTLWTTPSGRATTFTFQVPRGAILAVQQSATVEARLVFGAMLDAAIDRPLTVTGRAVALDQLSLSYAVTRTPAATTLSLLGLPAPVPQPATTVEVIAIENALLTTTGVAWLSGAMALTGRQATAGLLAAALPLLDLLPTLPDPYVSNDRLAERSNLNAGLLAEVGWATPATPGIGFTLLPPAAGAQRPAPGPGIGNIRNFSGVTALLDVSSRADQFGVVFRSDDAPNGQISGQTLQLTGRQMGVFTVPHISWEAVIADTVLNALGGATGRDAGAARSMARCRDRRGASTTERRLHAPIWV
jgi:hypothetical protein